MYEQANDTIEQGLSRGARIALGSLAALFGIFMLMAAPSFDQSLFVYGFGVFCLLIAAACVVQGRPRQFIGSVIGVAIFLAGIWYLGTVLLEGRLVSDSRAAPSALNAVLYLLFIGIPGAAYAYKVRFGFRKVP